MQKGLGILPSTNVTIRMEQDTKHELEMILKSMGLNLTTGFNLFATAVVRQRRIPFEIVADPFYAEANQARLKKSIAKLEAGEELIEKTWEELKELENA